MTDERNDGEQSTSKNVKRECCTGDRESADEEETRLEYFESVGNFRRRADRRLVGELHVRFLETPQGRACLFSPENARPVRPDCSLILVAQDVLPGLPEHSTGIVHLPFQVRGRRTASCYCVQKLSHRIPAYSKKQPLKLICQLLSRKNSF